jgi:hypothetical protein
VGAEQTHCPASSSLGFTVTSPRYGYVISHFVFSALGWELRVPVLWNVTIDGFSIEEGPRDSELTNEKSTIGLCQSPSRKVTGPQDEQMVVRRRRGRLAW